MTAKRATKRPQTKAKRSKSTEPATEAPRAESWRVNVAPDRPPHLICQDELCEWLQVDRRSIANYVDRGLPRHQARPRPLYSASDALTWSSYFEMLKRRFQNFRETPPYRIEMADAIAWHLEREWSVHPEPWNSFVRVPMDIRHPLRRQLLAQACEGVDTGYLDLDDLAV